MMSLYREILEAYAEYKCNEGVIMSFEMFKALRSVRC